MRVLTLVPDPSLRSELCAAVRAVGYAVSEASGLEQLRAHREHHRVDAILMDLGEDRDLADLSSLAAENPEVEIVALGARPTAARVVEALRRGAADFLPKPFSTADLERVLARLQRGREAEPGPFLTVDPAVRGLLEQLHAAARTDATIRIVGESGTGKSLLARVVHCTSARRYGPRVVISGSGLTAGAAERELFGEALGVGGREPLRGSIAAAEGGTLVLEEVADLPLPLQEKILRVLQERRVLPVGGRRSRAVDLRVVATTRRDLRREVEAGRFRRDLTLRLDVVRFEIPPLRERPDDVLLLARTFLERHARAAQVEPPFLLPDAEVTLRCAPLRGNARELDNWMRRMVLLHPGEAIGAERLESPGPLQAAAPESSPGSLNLRELERAAVIRSLQMSGGNRTLASQALGISVRTLRNKIRLYQLR